MFICGVRMRTQCTLSIDSLLHEKTHRHFDEWQGKYIGELRGRGRAFERACRF